MALLTDGQVSTLSDLQAYDSSILETAKTESVPLGAKLSVAEEAIGLEIAAFLLRAQSAATLSAQESAYELSRVVVTPALRRWHSLRTLAEVYCDVHNSQLNDRYLGRWKHFSKLSRDAADLIFELGVGVVNAPVPRPRKPVVTAVGAGGVAGSYSVQIAWRSASGASGALSEPAGLNATEGELFQVDAGVAPGNVSGFDVYAGVDGGPVTLQTITPMQVGAVWAVPVTGLIAGLPPSEGQGPDYYIRRNRAL